MYDALPNARKLQHGVFQCTTTAINTIELGYNDFGLCDTSAKTSYVLWYQLNSRKAVLFCTAWYDIRASTSDKTTLPVVVSNIMFQ
jgi:hypothetical protein